MSTPAHTTRPDLLELGGGVRCTGQEVVLVDLLAGRLLKAPKDPAAPLEPLAQLPSPIGAVAPVAGRPGTWIAAAATGVCLLTPGGETSWLARPEDGGTPRMRMNDAVADPSGRVWAGSMGHDADEDDGSLYRVHHDGTVVRVLDGITIPNGPVSTPDGEGMYLADSARGVIRRHPVDPDTGALGTPEVFATVEDGSPDGMTVDSEGALWAAVWGTGTVRRHLADGTPDRVLRLPARRPAGVYPEHDAPHITTARLGLPDPCPEDGAVFSVRVDVPGTPTPALSLHDTGPVPPLPPGEPA
jgi:sugar lactone lactonase YvrE